MVRLNATALKILHKELQKCTEDDIAGQVQRDIVLKRWEKLHNQEGSLVSLEELKDTVIDILPNFNEKVLKSAVNTNHSHIKVPISGIIVGLLLWTTGILVSSAGLIWLVNLPYPMIRLPVSKVAPMLLLPSYIAMDNSYRRAIALIEQADQLVNQATSIEDFNLGAEKVKEAQKHLDNLPVWFLGYQPQFYCSMFSCSWQFTLDEFKSARANIGRMEAKLFQENNATKILNQAEQAINTAKQQYQQAVTFADKQIAIQSWQAAIDQIQEISSATLARKTAQTKLTAYRRDFQQVAGLAAGNSRTGTLIAAAQQFADAATKSAQNPPHKDIEWQQIENLWQEAINRLTQIPLQDVGYIDAQKLLATYQINIGIVQTQLQSERQSVAIMEQAQRQIEILLASTPTDAKSLDRNRTISQLQAIINQLEKVQSGTTVYAKSQELLISAKNKLKQLQPQK